MTESRSLCGRRGSSRHRKSKTKAMKHTWAWNSVQSTELRLVQGARVSGTLGTLEAAATHPQQSPREMNRKEVLPKSPLLCWGTG